MKPGWQYDNSGWPDNSPPAYVEVHHQYHRDGGDGFGLGLFLGFLLGVGLVLGLML